MGLACAQTLAEAGFDLLLAGRTEASLVAARNEIMASNPDRTVVILVADVGVSSEATQVAIQAVAEFGQLDVMITAAAFFDPAPIIDMAVDTWDATMNTCLRGTFLCAAEAARQMRLRGGGRIILFGSVSADQSEPEVAHYNAAKAAIVSLAHSMAMEFAPHGIIVNAVGPGWVKTRMSEEAIRDAAPGAFSRINALGRWGEPAEVASVVRYLATDAPAFLNGQHILIDGGQTFMAPMP